MADLIDRQAAIDAFLTELTKRERKNLLHTWSTVEVKYFVVEMLERLPSSQHEIIHCRDCKYWNPYSMECEGIGNWFGFEGAWEENGYCYKAERRTDE